MYDYLELKTLALKILGGYADMEPNELHSSMGLWDDLALDGHDLMLVVVDILEEMEVRVDVNDERLSDLLEAETIKEFLQSLYTADI